MTYPSGPDQPGTSTPDQSYGPPQGYRPPQGYGDDRDGQPRRRRKRRRVFFWVFLAIQVIFLIWIIVGAATVHTAPTTADLASACYQHHWYPLYKSQADCVTHYGGALQTAGDLGKGLGIAAVIALWVAVDIILGISYGVYRLATRSRYR